MSLEVVWAILPEGRWKSAEALGKALRLRERALRHVVEFLVRWGFVETRRLPSELQVRRRPGAVSPMDVASLISSAIHQVGSIDYGGHRTVAERVACRVCRGRNFNFVGQNEVECASCHEKQWYRISLAKERLGPRRSNPRDGSSQLKCGSLRKE